MFFPSSGCFLQPELWGCFPSRSVWSALIHPAGQSILIQFGDFRSKEIEWKKTGRQPRLIILTREPGARPAPGSGQWQLMAALLHAPKSLSPQPNNPPTTPLSGSPSQHKTQRRETHIEQFCERETSSIHPKFGWVAQHCIVVKDQTI